MTSKPKPLNISAPGVYDLTPEQYHDSEPCASPSISSSGLREIENKCPAKYWWNSPLNPDRPKKQKREWSIGIAAHDLILQGDRFFDRNHVLGQDVKLTTKDGRAEKKDAEAAGMNVIKHEDFLAIKAMRDELFAHEFAGAAFTNGRAEQSLIWQDEETGVWLRCRPDWLHDVPIHIPDYKTAVSAEPMEFMRQVWNLGYYMQAALYLDGIDAVMGCQPQSFYFIVQEKEPPYVVQCVALEPIDIEWGRAKNRRAIRLFADCLERDHWPGYSSDVRQMGLPLYAQYELQRQHDAGRFDYPTSKEEDAA